MVTTATYSSCDNGRQWLSIEYGLQHTEKRRYSRASLVHPPLMQQQHEQPLPPPPASMLIMAQCQPSQTLANASLIESSSKRNNTQLGHPLKSLTVERSCSSAPIGATRQNCLAQQQQRPLVIISCRQSSDTSQCVWLRLHLRLPSPHHFHFIKATGQKAITFVVAISANKKNDT